jgi:dipeptidyl aminopeptidase/acylaminoacyl peptidase
MWWMMALMVGGLAGHAVLVGMLARSFIRPPRFRVNRTPAVYNLPFRELLLTSADGVALKGWYVPGSGPAGIVLCHGFPMNREDVVDFLPWLHRAGFHVLAFDFRALGESSGDTCTFGHLERHDVAAAVAELARQPGVDPDRIGALGLSMGGASVLMAAAETPAIRAVVSDSAFARLDEMVGERFRHVPLFYRGALSASVRYCAERWTGYTTRDVAPVAAIGRIPSGRVLLIHGTGDGLVPLRHARQLQAAARPPVELWEVPDVRHVGAHAADPAAYEQRVVHFFRDRLCGTGAPREAEAGDTLNP